MRYPRHLRYMQVGVPHVSISNERLLTYQLLQHLTPEATSAYRNEGVGAFEWEDPSVQMVRYLSVTCRLHTPLRLDGALPVGYMSVTCRFTCRLHMEDPSVQMVRTRRT